MNNSIETINPSDLVTVKGNQDPILIRLNEDYEGHSDSLWSEYFGNTEDMTFHKSWFVENIVVELNEGRTPIDMSVFQFDTSQSGIDSSDKITKFITVPSEYVIHGTGSKLEMFNPTNPTLM